MTFLLSVGTLLDQDKVIDNQRTLGNQQQAIINIQSQIKTFKVELTSETVSKIEIANRRARELVEKYGLTSTSEDFKSRTCVEPIISIGQGSFIKNAKITYLPSSCLLNLNRRKFNDSLQSSALVSTVMQKK